MSILEYYDEELHMRTMKEIYTAEGYAEGRAEGLTEGLRRGVVNLMAKFGPLPEKVKIQIEEQDDPNVLLRWQNAAVDAQSLDAFLRAAGDLDTPSGEKDLGTSRSGKDNLGTSRSGKD